MTKTKKIILSITGIIVLLISAYCINWWYHARILFNDANDLQKGSYEFNLLISDSIKNMPTHNAIPDSIKYNYNVGGGNSCPSDELQFSTLSSPDSIFTFYKNYFNESGYMPKHPDFVTEKNIIYGNESETFNVYIETENNQESVVYIVHQL